MHCLKLHSANELRNASQFYPPNNTAKFKKLNITEEGFFIAAPCTAVLSDRKPSSSGTTLTAALIKTATRNAIYVCGCKSTSEFSSHSVFMCSKRYLKKGRLFFYKYTDGSFSYEENVPSVRYGQRIYIQPALDSALNSLTILGTLNTEQ